MADQSFGTTGFTLPSAVSIVRGAQCKLSTTSGAASSRPAILERDTTGSGSLVFVAPCRNAEASAAVQGLNGPPTEGRALYIAMDHARG